MPDLAVTITDERSITIPTSADNGQTEQIGKYIVSAAQDGYVLKSVTPIQVERGNQFDPYTVTTGVKLTFSKDV